MITSFSSLAAVWAAFLMHPVHETVCELEWNPNNRRVEVAMRIDVLDEQWIAHQLDAKIDTDSNSDWRGKFLRSQLFFDPVASAAEDSQPTGRPIRWIGRKKDGAHVWWFFEVVCDDGKPPTTIRTRLLFDRQSNYQHRVVVLGTKVSEDAKRPSFVLTNQNPSASLELVK